MKILVPKLPGWQDDPTVAQVIALYKERKSKKRKLQKSTEEPPAKRHRKEIAKRIEDSPAIKIEPKAPDIIKKDTTRYRTIERNGETKKPGKYFDRECSRLQQEGTKMKRDTHGNAKTEEEKFSGYLGAGLKYLESAFAAECALDMYIEENNSDKVSRTRKNIIRVCRDVATYFQSCRCIVNSPSRVGIFYLAQAVLCFRAFNLSQRELNNTYTASNGRDNCDIESGKILNVEQEEYLVAALDLLRGNQNWEKAIQRGAPFMHNPHDVECISKLVDLVRKTLET